MMKLTAMNTLWRSLYRRISPSSNLLSDSDHSDADNDSKRGPINLAKSKDDNTPDNSEDSDYSDDSDKSDDLEM